MNKQFTRVGIHDSKWRIEAVEFDQNKANLTKAYPRWFIELLVNQHHRGHSIEWHVPTNRWFLRNPFGPDYALEDGQFVCQNHEGICFVQDAFTLEKQYRLWDEIDGE